MGGQTPGDGRLLPQNFCSSEKRGRDMTRERISSRGGVARNCFKMSANSDLTISPTAGLRVPAAYPRTETPEKESSTVPRTGCPNTRAGANTLKSSVSFSWERVLLSALPETIL
jgi:hypothetical protein